jgi:rhamnosyl/mannosyltransferase
MPAWIYKELKVVPMSLASNLDHHRIVRGTVRSTAVETSQRQSSEMKTMINSRRIKICHLGKYYPPAPGGMETHVQTLAQTQASLGADVTVVCVDHLDRDPVAASAGNAADHPHLSNINVHREGDGSVRVIRVPSRFSINRLEICPSLPALLRALSHEGVDVFHLHTPNPTMLLALAVAPPKVPYVITHHSDIIRQRILRLALRPFERLVYSRTAQIYTTSSVYLSGSGFLSRYAERVHALPLGVNLSPYREPSKMAQLHARELKQKHGCPLWLSVGRLVYYKALHIALKALRNVPGKLMIIGTGPLENRLKEMAREFGVEDRVIWRGYANEEELVGAYLAADALWFPSNARSEAFGLVQVEAMASGCPVINTNIPGSGVSWVSRHEESGVTIPVDDSDALAAAANQMLRNPAWRNSLAVGAQNRAQEQFDHMTMARLSLARYHGVLRNKRTAADGRITGSDLDSAVALLDADEHPTTAL